MNMPKNSAHDPTKTLSIARPSRQKQTSYRTHAPNAHACHAPKRHRNGGSGHNVLEVRYADFPDIGLRSKCFRRNPLLLRREKIAGAAGITEGAIQLA